MRVIAEYEKELALGAIEIEIPPGLNLDIALDKKSSGFGTCSRICYKRTTLKLSSEILSNSFVIEIFKMS